MQKIIIGTAGHVDHGKSALAKALTGVDPDRLPEEKTREMTIDLGFVFLPLNNNEEAAIIDVPGHERFLKTMIAGATSVRMVLFIVAADEGVMPQTVEHLDILKLLGIKKGVIVITKIDKVDEEYVTVVKEDIRELVKDSFLKSAPIFTVSSINNHGIEKLKNGLKDLCSNIEPLSDRGIFRCPIDRIFSMKGFGSVVAGTVISGKLKKTEAVEVLPIEKKSRIRNLQVHNESVSEVFVGQRAAFNLADITIPELSRGYELSIPDYLKPTQVINTRFSLLANARRPLKNNERVRLHKGTGEIMARAITLGKDKIAPGEQGFVQFRLEKPVVGERKERFLIRSYSPMRVIGGGMFLEVYPVKKGGLSKKERVEYLQKLEKVKDTDIAEMIILYARHPIAYEKELMKLTNIPKNEVALQMQRLLKEDKILKLRDNSIVHRQSLKDLKKRCLASVEQFVKANPLKVVMKRGELAKVLKVSHVPLLDKVFEELSAECKIELKTDGVRITDMAVKLSSDAQRISDEIEKFTVNKGYKPFKYNNIINTFPGETKGRIKNLVDYLLKNDVIIEISNGLYLHKNTLAQAKTKLMEHLNTKGTIRAIEYRDVLGVSRNVARDILDYFFDHGITVRTKGTHRLANKEDSK